MRAEFPQAACAQALVSRETSPLGTAVVSVTKQAAGEGAYNVIPESASFGGTIRSLSHDHLMQLKRRIAEVHAYSPNCCECALLVLGQPACAENRLNQRPFHQPWLIREALTGKGCVASADVYLSGLLEGRAVQVAQGVATSFQCSAEVDWLEETEKYYPPTVNNKETYKFAVEVGKR